MRPLINKQSYESVGSNTQLPQILLSTSYFIYELISAVKMKRCKQMALQSPSMQEFFDNNYYNLTNEQNRFLYAIRIHILNFHLFVNLLFLNIFQVSIPALKFYSRLKGKVSNDIINN